MTLGVLFLAHGCILCVFALARAGEGLQHLHLGACQRNMQRESSNKAISPPGADSPGPCPARMPAQRLYASPALPSLRQLHASPARKSKNSGGSGRTPTHRRRRENEAAWWENEAARRGGEAASWESEKHAPPLSFPPALLRARRCASSGGSRRTPADINRRRENGFKKCKVGKWPEKGNVRPKGQNVATCLLSRGLSLGRQLIVSRKCLLQICTLIRRFQLYVFCLLEKEANF